MPATNGPARCSGSTLVVAAGLALSGIAPYSRVTWYLEIFPIAIVFAADVRDGDGAIR